MMRLRRRWVCCEFPAPWHPDVNGPNKLLREGGPDPEAPASFRPVLVCGDHDEIVEIPKHLSRDALISSEWDSSHFDMLLLFRARSGSASYDLEQVPQMLLPANLGGLMSYILISNGLHQSTLCCLSSIRTVPDLLSKGPAGSTRPLPQIHNVVPYV